MDERLWQALVVGWHACPADYRHPQATEDELRAFEAEFGPIPPVFREYLKVCRRVALIRSWGPVAPRENLMPRAARWKRIRGTWPRCQTDRRRAAAEPAQSVKGCPRHPRLYWYPGGHGWPGSTNRQPKWVWVSPVIGSRLCEATGPHHF
jgi:hypothetical protein